MSEKMRMANAGGICACCHCCYEPHDGDCPCRCPACIEAAIVPRRDDPRRERLIQGAASTRALEKAQEACMLLAEAAGLLRADRFERMASAASAAVAEEAVRAALRVITVFQEVRSKELPIQWPAGSDVTQEQSRSR